MIGGCVLDQLRQVDEVAYVRFASVYRSFQSVDEFFALLSAMRQPPEAL
jgi:transcriptional repressor NrdR